MHYELCIMYKKLLLSYPPVSLDVRRGGRHGVRRISESAAIEYQHLQMQQLLLFSLSSQKNYKFIYSFFGGLQIHRTSAATGVRRGVRWISESAAIEYQHLQMRQFLLFSLSPQKNYKFIYPRSAGCLARGSADLQSAAFAKLNSKTVIYSFFVGLQIHRTSAATGNVSKRKSVIVK